MDFVLPVKNLGGDISVAHGLFPRAADEVALLGAEETGISAVTTISTAESGYGLSSHSCAGLVKVKFNCSTLRTLEDKQNKYLKQ